MVTASNPIDVKSNLDAVFKAKSIAVIGASNRAGAVGGTVVKNLITGGYKGAIYPINPKDAEILGLPAYKTVAECPQVPDMAVLVIPAKFVPKSIEECSKAGVKAAVVISAGFREVGEEGLALEHEMMRVKGNMSIVGPNCLGVMCPTTDINATFASSMASKGSVAFFSQSGAMCTSILDWSHQVGVGFSAFVSTGAMTDVCWGDLIEYFGEDENTSAICMYMEGMGDHPESFFNACRKVSLTKPIILIKAGRTAAGAQAASSHTGSLTGSDDVLNSLCERAGVLRVEEIQDLFVLADCLAKQPLPKNNNMTIVTNAGGPGVLSTDALISGGGNLTELSPEIMAKLNSFLPEAWSHNNPVDVIGDAGAEIYAKSLEVCAVDENCGGLLVILTPQSVTDPKGTAVALTNYAHAFPDKTILASWMGGVDVEEGVEILRNAGIPCFDYPDTACKVFNYLCKYKDNLKQLYDVPAGVSDPEFIEGAKEKAREIMAEAIAAKRSVLTEYESKMLLNAYGIRICDTRIAFTPEEAVKEAKAIGYPVCVKIHSEIITHKSDVGGVKLGLKTDEEVLEAWNDMETRIGRPGFLGVTVQPMISFKDGHEVIVGMNTDPQYGPVVVFGAGGILVEIFKDSALALPPISRHISRRMIRKTKIYEAIKGFRGKPSVNLYDLETLLIRFGNLVSDLPEIAELDINPVLARPDACYALDARVILNEEWLENPNADIPKNIISTFPKESAKVGNVAIRGVLPDDADQIEAFIKDTQNVESRYTECIGSMTEARLHCALRGISMVDYHNEVAFVAVDGDKVVGIARAINRCSRFAIVVAQEYRRQGVASALMDCLKRFAARNNFQLRTVVEKTNEAGQKFLQKEGLTLSQCEKCPNTICAQL